jgi:hypothetical protein
VHAQKNGQETPVAAHRESKEGPPGFKGAGRPEGQAARMDGLSVGARTLAIKLHEQAGCWTQLRGALPAAVLRARVA